MKRKTAIISDFKQHVSSQKVAFFKKYGMDFVLGERENIRIEDIENGTELINLHCNGGVFNLGHRNPQIIAALKEALDHFDIGNHHFISLERAKAAKMLSDLMPGDLTYTVFGVSGGEATDTAIKVARSFTQKQKIISVKGGYHGHTGFALATGDEKYRKPFGDELPGFEQCTFGDIGSLQSAIDANTAAVILETIPATLGMPVPSPEYMQNIRQLCDENQVLLILDEVQSGLGRTGKLWAFEHYDIVPDIVILGKGLSGGIYPISATVLRKPLESVFHPDPFIHISTFGGAEPGCIVLQKVLEISSSPDFLAHVNHMATIFKAETDKLIEKHGSFLVGLRQKGLMMGLELKDTDCGPLLTKTAYDNGLLIVYANNDKRVCQLLPPLITREDQVPEIMAKLDKALSKARKLRPLLKVRNLVTGLLKSADR
ncbi:MAG: aspartate aminotransferase family protein [Bacteroidetes bacterium]|nr:MAG: aspartate aminotransferase family protein [Bacteroidota bacterium]